MKTRRSQAKDDRQECKIWEPKDKNPIAWNKDDLACVPLDKSKCDDKCKADPNKLKHEIFKCVKERDCMETGPKDPKNNGIWVADKSKVKDNDAKAGLKYKVGRTKIGGSGEKTVPCMSFARMLADKDRFKDRMVKPATGDAKKVMYVSFKGRAFQCKLTKKDPKDAKKTIKDPMLCMD